MDSVKLSKKIADRVYKETNMNAFYYDTVISIVMDELSEPEALEYFKNVYEKESKEE